MKLLVIGASGRTGRHVLDQGLRRGHAITAFTRHLPVTRVIWPAPFIIRRTGGTRI